MFPGRLVTLIIRYAILKSSVVYVRHTVDTIDHEWYIVDPAPLITVAHPGKSLGEPSIQFLPLLLVTMVVNLSEPRKLP